MVGKWIQRGFLLGSTLLASAAIGPGCADPESSIFIRQVAAVQPPECIPRAEPDGAAIGVGVIDVALTDEYQAALLVGNQLVSRGNQDQVRTETSRIAMTSASVHINDVSGAQLGAFSVPITGFVDQSQGNEPGYGLTIVPLIDANALKSIRDKFAADLAAGGSRDASKRLVVTVNVTGRTLGGSELTSGDFQFVIRACYGCLVTFSTEFDKDPTDNVIDCLGGADAAAAANNEAPCRAGQDQPISCRDCLGKGAVCQYLSGVAP